MSIGNTNTKVYLYNNDYNALCTEIYHHKHIETGGDLFGLWTTTGDAVVHVALGPGKKCKRTTVSFHQDIAYLSRVGTFLTQKFMLCHIGEWHSHHHLSLNEPSSGDKRTVRENYPNGMKKFLVIIGNIVGPDRVVLSPYYFSDDGNTCEKGILHVLDGTVSPFTTDLTIAKEINEGAENPGDLSIMTSGSSVSADKTPSDITFPPPDYDTSLLSQTTPRSPSEQTMTPQSSGHPSTPVESNDNQKQTRKEINLKRVHDEIQSKFSHSGIVMEGASSDDEIRMKFKHNSKYWLIRFPKSFPEDAATLSWSYDEKFSRVQQCRVRNPKSLNNYITILLLVKENCSSYCSCCDKITAQSLSESGTTLNLLLTQEGEALFHELCTKIGSTLTIEGNLRKQIKHSKRQDPTVEVSFMHSLKNWTVELSSTFPITPAVVTYQDKGNTHKHDVRLNREYRSIALDLPSKILSAINKKCYCDQCKRLV